MRLKSSPCSSKSAHRTRIAIIHQITVIASLSCLAIAPLNALSANAEAEVNEALPVPVPNSLVTACRSFGGDPLLAEAPANSGNFKFLCVCGNGLEASIQLPATPGGIAGFVDYLEYHCFPSKPQPRPPQPEPIFAE